MQYLIEVENQIRGKWSILDVKSASEFNSANNGISTTTSTTSSCGSQGWISICISPYYAEYVQRERSRLHLPFDIYSKKSSTSAGQHRWTYTVFHSIQWAQDDVPASLQQPLCAYRTLRVGHACRYPSLPSPETRWGQHIDQSEWGHPLSLLPSVGLREKIKTLHPK